MGGVFVFTPPYEEDNLKGYRKPVASWKFFPTVYLLIKSSMKMPSITCEGSPLLADFATPTLANQFIDLKRYRYHHALYGSISSACVKGVLKYPHVITFQIEQLLLVWLRSYCHPLPYFVGLEQNLSFCNVFAPYSLIKTQWVFFLIFGIAYWGPYVMDF